MASLEPFWMGLVREVTAAGQGNLEGRVEGRVADESGADDWHRWWERRGILAQPVLPARWKRGFHHGFRQPAQQKSQASNSSFLINPCRTRSLSREKNYEKTVARPPDSSILSRIINGNPAKINNFFQNG
jgi:hypothetical protein